jgi:hypothetical protein
VPELDAGALAAAEPEAAEPEEPELEVVPEVAAEPPDVAAAAELLLADRTPALAAECVAPGR